MMVLVKASEEMMIVSSCVEREAEQQERVLFNRKRPLQLRPTLHSAVNKVSGTLLGSKLSPRNGHSLCNRTKAYLLRHADAFAFEEGKETEQSSNWGCGALLDILNLIGCW